MKNSFLSVSSAHDLAELLLGQQIEDDVVAGAQVVAELVEALLVVVGRGLQLLADALAQVIDHLAREKFPEQHEPLLPVVLDVIFCQGEIFVDGFHHMSPFSGIADEPAAR